MTKPNKTKYLQIRVTPEEKKLIEKIAKKNSKTISELVLDKLLSDNQNKDKFQSLVSKLSKSEKTSLVFAEINDFLNKLTKDEFKEATDEKPKANISNYHLNYLAAMVEYSANRKKVDPPKWVNEIDPLNEPVFGSKLKNLRTHLLLNSPIPFRKRNIFIDSTVGDRV